jgi:hypothetical protein
MAQYIDLDSILRDREDYPNENDYQLSPQQVEGWFRNSRVVTPLPQNPNTYPLGFVSSISIVDLALPYSSLLATMPRVYINFTSMLYRDVNLVQTINSSLPDAKFVCKYDKIQYDSLNTPIWIHYKCDMDQVMRFERRDPIQFQVLTRSGNVLPQQDTNVPADADPLKQTLCTLSITPYIQDGKFDNQMVETLNTS